MPALVFLDAAHVSAETGELFLYVAPQGAAAELSQLDF